MATETLTPRTGDAGILARLNRPDDGSLSPEVAKALLNIRFTELEVARIHELAVKN